MIYLALTLFLILFKAIPDGLYDRGLKTTAGFIQDVSWAIIITSLFCWVTATPIINWHYSPHVIKALVGFLFVKFAIYDPLYNLARGNSIFYIGKTKFFDKIVTWIMTKFKVQIILYIWIKFILFIMGIAFLFQVNVWKLVKTGVRYLVETDVLELIKSIF